MNRRLIVRPEAEADILKAALWYEGEAGLGLELSAEIRAAIDRAVENPLAYLRLRERPHVRRVLVHRFSLSRLLHRARRRNYSLCRSAYLAS